MPYRVKEQHYLVTRGNRRTQRHGNWRQTYIDCGGMCIAEIGDKAEPCGAVDFLELHEIWGENHDPDRTGKFQHRVLLCNTHHAMIEDKCHQYTFIKGQYQQSVLSTDVDLEILLAGNTDKWAERYKLDMKRWGCYLDSGLVKVAEIVEEETVEIPIDLC